MRTSLSQILPTDPHVCGNHAPGAFGPPQPILGSAVLNFSCVWTVLYVGSTERRVLVIGAGVVGSAIALSCAKRGWTTTVIERNHAPETGSTAVSSAVVRFTYSTIAGTALAYEGVEYWRNWAEFLGLPPGTPLARFVECGMVFFDAPSGLARLSLPPLDTVGVRYEWWDLEELERRMPFLATTSWFPPTRPDNEEFFSESTIRIGGARSRKVLPSRPQEPRAADPGRPGYRGRPFHERASSPRVAVHASACALRRSCRPYRCLGPPLSAGADSWRDRCRTRRFCRPSNLRGARILTDQATTAVGPH